VEAPIAIIGGGFYGASIAEFVARRGMPVVLIERELQLLTRASYHNQARLHGGYHYPRSFGTAYRSRLNFPRFVEEFRPAIAREFVKLYAVARVNSKINARQFEAFCRNIDAPLRPARPQLARLFSRSLVEAVYEAQEYVFDAAVLRHIMEARLHQAGVRVWLGRCVAAVRRHAAGLEVLLTDDTRLRVSRVYNCTYSALNTIAGISPTGNRLKHEITELALVELPEPLRTVSLTVMDGPFFSFMPFPDSGLATLSHVRYTPHAAWTEERDRVLDPYATLNAQPRKSRFPYMLRDAMRYLPALAGMVYQDSLFEVKTVLIRNEADDGRPILFEPDPADPRIVSILGSKVDNIYDALDAVDLGLRESAIA
jgi:glycine/D-amino acid oxidase-like deaminating enzyme